MKSSWTDHQSRLSPGLIFSLSHTFGVFPLRLEDGLFVLSPVGLFYSGVMIILLVFMLIFHTIVPLPFLHNNSFTIMLNIAQHIGTNSTIICSVWFVVRNRRILSDLFNTLVQFEYAMFRLGVQLPPYRWYNWTMGSLLVTWMVFGLDCYSDGTITLFWLFYNFNHYYLISLVILINSQISWIAGYIASAFGCLTEALEVSGELHKLVQWHRRLTVCCRMLSEVYSVEIFMLFAATLVNGTVLAYFTYSILQTQTLIYIIVCIYWTSIFYCICFKIIASCVQAKTKAAEFDAAVYRSIVFNEDDNFSFYGPAYRLYYHFKGSSVTFDVLGFFQIEWQLARTMIGAGITYVVILVQFS